jgi:MYXO-CTERM domain-containing protein
MTPTCVCDEGYIAIGAFTDEGMRETTCVEPEEAIAADFYGQRLPALPPNLRGGREVNTPQSGTAGETGTSGGAGAPGTGGTSTSATGGTDRGSAGAEATNVDGGGCSCKLASSGQRANAGWLLLAGLGLLVSRRRRYIGA